jgi:hypothetical protein
VVGAVLCGLVALEYTRRTRGDGARPADGPQYTHVAPNTALPSPVLTDEPLGKTKYNVEELRRRYPYESLEARLDYEAANADVGPTGLPDETMKRLATVEGGLEWQGRWSPRAKSLEQLHSDQVERFIASEGFGVSRMAVPGPSPRYLELVEAPPIPFASLKNLPPPEGTEVPAPLQRGGVAGQGPRQPPFGLLETFHYGGLYNFLHPSSFGHAKDREHVAGFVPHHFSRMPEMPRQPPNDPTAIPQSDKWLVSRLELVSLLKHGEPAVYVSDSLPRMDDLKKAKTRPLTEFEGNALAALKAGEDLVGRATPERIHLVGSLRATKQCLNCHHAQRGDLLGAFSYNLRRETPAPAGK